MNYFLHTYQKPKAEECFDETKKPIIFKGVAKDNNLMKNKANFQMLSKIFVDHETEIKI